MNLNGWKLKSIRYIVLGMAVALLAVPAIAGNAVYVVNGLSQFGTVDLSSGAFHAIGNANPDGQSNLVWGNNNSLYSLTITGNLETINPSTGAATVIGPTSLGYNALSLAGVGGKLYATDLSNNIYSVNPNTGAATMIGATGMPPDPTVPFTINPAAPPPSTPSRPSPRAVSPSLLSASAPWGDRPVCVTKLSSLPATRSEKRAYPYTRNTPSSRSLRHNAPGPGRFQAPSPVQHPAARCPTGPPLVK